MSGFRVRDRGWAHWLVGLERGNGFRTLWHRDAGRTAVHRALCCWGGGLLGMVLVRDRGVGARAWRASRTAPGVWPLRPGQYENHATSSWPMDFPGRRGCWVWPGFSLLPGPVNGLPVFWLCRGVLRSVGMHAALSSGHSPAGFWRPLPDHAGIPIASESNGGEIRRGAGLNSGSHDSPGRGSDRQGLRVENRRDALGFLWSALRLSWVSGVMIESFRDTVERWIDQTLIADLVVTPA